MSRLGVNTILTVSQLLVKAGSYSQGLPLYQYVNSLYKKYYQPDFNLNKFPSAIYTLIKGRKKKESNLDFDKFLITTSSSIPFSQSLEIGFNIYNKLHQDFQVYDLATNIDAIEAIVQSTASLNYKLGKEIFFGLDLKASNFEKNGLYHLRDRANPLRSDDYFSYLDSMIKRYAFLILIDPLANQDISSWTSFNQKISKDVYLAGNDLTCSNQEKIKKAISDKAISSFVIKTHQAGTIKQIFDLVKLARENSLSYIFSSGSEETNDSFQADLAYGLQAEFVSFGPPHGGENISKYNRMLKIEGEITKK
jgi:enolase